MHSDPLAVASPTPDLKELCKEFSACAPLTTSGWGVPWVDQIRFCTWPGQSSDGKKHGSKTKEAFPWEGSSDTKVMLADRIIGENVGLLVSAFWASMVRPKAADDEAGSYAVALVDYFLNEVLYEELVREVELSAQYREHYGWFVLHPTWVQKVTLRRQKVTLMELGMYALTNAQALGIDENTLNAWQVMIQDPTQDEATAQILRVLWDHSTKAAIPPDLARMVPDPSDAKLRRAVKELREKGQTEVVYPGLERNGPQITALKPYDEVWLPADTADLQSARVIFQREYLSAADLKARIRTDDYNAAWVEKVIENAGHGASFWNLPVGEGGSISGLVVRAEAQSVVLGHGLCEILHAFRRSVDADNVPGIYCTTFSGVVTRNADGGDLYGKHELLEYPHGDYPYVGGAREYCTRRFTASRGVPEIVHTTQNEAKALRDGQIDRTSITVLPPVNYYQTPLETEYRFGPAVRNKVIPGKEPAFMQMPSGQGMVEAATALEALNAEVDNYFGLMSERVTPQRVQNVQARSAGGFLLTWSRSFQQTVALAQRYMPDAEFAKVTGAPEGWLEQRREQLGLLSAQLQFDVRELDSELAQKRIEAMNTAVLPSDVTGVINRAKWVEIQVRSINPLWARELIVDGADASAAMFKGVLDDLAQMFLGNEASYVENDPAAGNKVQYAQQIIQANPTYQEALKQGGRFADLLQKWSQNMTFSVQQQQNKQIGRIGVTPEESA